MSEIEKAKQIAAEAFNFKSKAYTTIEQQNEIIEVNRKAFMQILSLPSLMIPKSIADEIEEKALDDYGVFQTLAQKKHIISDPEPFCDLSDEFISWCENNEKWWAIMNAYLAGKALGVDLVKVGEG